ncbi:PLD nuclease N-terminal domain-containing protein [Salegentibacter mishustinae]|jgi:hypothetical protein|uniref:Cardiolipin synthase N-terminal domain-containing protein n=1 Tax=Salegentibacter mishustinae TaxID=270918 RepID=A0A0Q9ZJP1_9FLAO|nr:PLD nuclease N-terminal domain-containing protein [Salegentibacter mishustinae]KRG29047.1 hypothetical protein APR42_03725 [Salegentibacter mishustinae]MDX1426341.1 PLD nuclease N-terminal domain-containing protein [Salegentibacter mishustinae]MDX1719907.1 PLD nuclease N-terminal domain-containing protein [Salegentibacter mishustinae]PNW21901.1 hypothetical protein APB85_11765 [Salegentibacter mishustinae]PZX65249.1 phospholipase D-like protein [Salegentibacter mishustinae]
MEITAIESSIVVWQTIILLHTVLFLISLVDILRNKFEKNNKLIWFVSIIIVPLLGPILYFLIGRKQKV